MFFPTSDCAYPQFWSEPLAGRPGDTLWTGYQTWALMDTLRLLGKTDTRFAFKMFGICRNDTKYPGIHPAFQVMPVELP